MGILCFPLLLFISILSFIFVNDVVHGKCLEDQRLALLEFKQNITFIAEEYYQSKPSFWNSSTDCCSWAGVTCEDGLVVGIDLGGEGIYGDLDDSSSLFELRHLRSLNLSDATFFTSIPSAIGKLKNLVSLDLSEAGFFGQIPMEISRLTKLRALHLSSRFNTGPLELKDPNLRILVQNLSKLQELNLDGVDISAWEREWAHMLAFSLPNLRVLSLSDCYLSGLIPNSLANLSQLVHLDLSFNSFTGQIDDSLTNLRSLLVIELSMNNFQSSVPKFSANFSNLISLGLHASNLLGNFPEEIFQIPSLQTLDLSANDLFGPLQNSFANLSQLVNLDLSSNNFTGPIPNSFANLNQLVHLDLSSNTLNGPIPNLFANQSHELVDLDLSSNTFTGQIPTSYFKSLEKLVSVDLSSNSFSGSIPSSLFNLSSLRDIFLSHNHFDGLFPKFSNATSSQLSNIDFSDNQIGGDIPSWIWEVNLECLNLSHNLLVNLQKPFGIPTSLGVLDLNSNNLHGEIPIPPERVRYVDYTSNYFSSSIPVDYFSDFPDLDFFSVSSNNMTGSIPESICNVKYLKVLDLSQNNLSGTILSCLAERTNQIAVLNLAENKLVGNISGTFPIYCTLQTLDLHGNLLGGMIPESLSKCKELKVLNLGNNMIDDKFPCWLKNLADLRVLVLRSNWFQGNLQCLEANQSWKTLQIIDLASNNFSGILPTKGFLNFKAMMGDEEKFEVPKPLGYERWTVSSTFFYQDKVKLTSKGLQMELVKIFTIFTLIDLSSNMFQGNVPEEIGHLKSLHFLNLSNNALTGQIPSSFRSLKDLESLDLSKNKLYGVIPLQLGGLTFLAFLNLSFNQLEGMIPKGRQLQTFTEASFQGNKGLCGTPLNVKCQDSGVPGLSPPAYENMHFGAEIDWDLIAAEIGFAFGLGIFIVLLVFCGKWRKYYYEHVDQFLSKIFNMRRQESGRRERRRGRTIQRRSI